MADQTTSPDRRRVKRIVRRTGRHAEISDEWLRERLRDPKQRERIFRQSVAFALMFGLNSGEAVKR